MLIYSLRTFINGLSAETANPDDAYAHGAWGCLCPEWASSFWAYSATRRGRNVYFQRTKTIVDRQIFYFVSSHPQSPACRYHHRTLMIDFMCVSAGHSAVCVSEEIGHCYCGEVHGLKLESMCRHLQQVLKHLPIHTICPIGAAVRFAAQHPHTSAALHSRVA